MGRYVVLTSDEAREEARQLLAAAARGADSAEQRTADRAAWAVKRFSDDDLAGAKAGTVLTRRGVAVRVVSLATEDGCIKRHIIPLLGHRVVRDLKTSDVEPFLKDATAGRTADDVKTGFRGRAIVRGGRGTAKRTLSLLAGALAHGVRMGLIERNPAHGVRRRADGKRNIADFPAKNAAPGRALALARDRRGSWQAVQAIRLVALSGIRRGEAIGLRWSEVDFAGPLPHLDRTKTGESIHPRGKLPSICCDRPEKGARPESSFSRRNDTTTRHLAVCPRPTVASWGMPI